ncbi:HTH_Tnp_Tc3_2 domain-containing protein [Trichonephila clavipes]|nr:HTH_Tnp_Tc3_2 domain-containing protein [Trichonephila clavipes]
MTVTDIIMAVVAIELSVLRTFQNSGSSSPKRKEKYKRVQVGKTIPRIDKILIRERSSKINPKKIIIDLCRYLLDNGVEVSASTARKMLLEGGLKATRQRKKTISNSESYEKTFSTKKYRSWTRRKGF